MEYKTDYKETYMAVTCPKCGKSITVSDKKTGTAKDYVNKLEWDCAIAAAEQEIDALRNSGSQQLQVQGNATVTNQTSKEYQISGTVQTTGTPQQSSPQQQLAEAYLYRGIARCLKANKEGAYDEAIKDLSRAITLGAYQARYYLGYACYLNADYERAIAHCKKSFDKKKKSELLGKIYMAMGRYKEAADSFANALKAYFAAKQHPGPHLLHEYQEARKRMNSV
jgi:tetratricopeptide (TPR) repeat protein